MDFVTIINGCLKNDIKCQQMFFNLHYSRLMAISLRMSPNREIAEDMIQEAFIKIFKDFNPKKSFEPAMIYSWCKRIITNTILDYYKKHKIKEILFDDDDDFDIPYEDSGYDVDYLTSKNITAEQIILSLQKLPPKYNLVFNLFVMEGYTHEEISKILNINIGTSKSNLHKAKIKLRKELVS